MAEAEAYLVEGESIIPIEIQPMGAVGPYVRCRPAGSDEPYRTAYSSQIADTIEQAQEDIERWRSGADLPRVSGRGNQPLLERWGQARANQRRAR